MIGARQGTMTALRRLAASAMARDLRGFVVPGPDVARAAGLDLGGAGVFPAATPRHASVLVVIGILPDGLSDAASVAYAQMPRPRAILALGSGNLAPLPDADATGPLTQAGLVAALADLRRAIATGAFQPDTTGYAPPALQTGTEFTCPMHPEVVSDKPGDCPKCGMTLVPRETAGSPHAGHAMPGMAHEMPSAPPRQKMAEGHDHAKHATVAALARYTCPMHPEVVSDEPGKCPKCGMTLVPDTNTNTNEHAGHAMYQGGDGSHGAHRSGEAIDGIEAHFMSMAGMTENMPASPDGLKMEWIDVPFGPFFPGLPGGLRLDLTLDGDAVVEAKADSRLGNGDLLPGDGMTPEAFADHLAVLSPLSPVAYRELACRALTHAAGQSVSPDAIRARAAAVERERVASHLNWLAGFGAQSGVGWLEARATVLQLKIREATGANIAAVAPAVTSLLRRVQRTPLLTARLRGIGEVTGDDTLSGPVARAAGIACDARSDDPVYAALGFAVLTRTGGDALARLTQRCGEIAQSLDLIASAGAVAMPAPQVIGTASGNGEASVETPRGAARLTLTLTDGKVTAAEIGTPSAAHVALITAVAEGRELGDALTAIGSLDISPWETAT